MFGIKFIRDKHMLTIGTWFWAFYRVREEDYGSSHWEDWTYYRTVVLHIGRLHLTAEWRIVE